MHAISNSRCQTDVIFVMIMYGERRGRSGEEFLGCGCCTGHRKRGTSLIFLERTGISCKAEMLCLGQAKAELLSANKLGFCAAVLQYWRPCTAVWKHLLPHLLHKPFGNKRKGIEIHREEYHGALDLEEICRFQWISVFWCSFEP